MTETPIFADLKVIDCASFIAGPAAATILADHGADVIKVEPPAPATRIASSTAGRACRTPASTMPG